MASKSNKLMISIILLVAGAVLIYLGYSEAESIGGQIGSTFSGTPSNRVLIFYVAGAVCGLLGLFMVFKK